VLAVDFGEHHDAGRLFPVSDGDLAHNRVTIGEEAVHLEAPVTRVVGYRACKAAKSLRPTIRSPEQGQSITQSGAR
jgi:hypothetical protein